MPFVHRVNIKYIPFKPLPRPPFPFFSGEAVVVTTNCFVGNIWLSTIFIPDLQFASNLRSLVYIFHFLESLGMTLYMRTKIFYWTSLLENKVSKTVSM